MTIEEWIPEEDTAIQEFVVNCKKLNNLASVLEEKLANMLYDNDDAYHVSIYESLSSSKVMFKRTDCNIFSIYKNS